MWGLDFSKQFLKDDILALEDKDDHDGDGISGRANYVWDRAKNEHSLGRFGWKANVATLEQQNAGAFLGDMGLTSKFFKSQNCKPQDKDCLNAPAMDDLEVSDKNLKRMTTYVRLLAVPQQRNSESPAVQRGHQIFHQLECQNCHTQSFTTAEVEGFPELSGQEIHPFTDLLLHDMGEGLSDGRPDFEANGREWRTPPLWGIGLIKTVNGHTRFLHDGRARNIEEAILWHGGEAEASKDSYLQLSKKEREDLLQFLESL